MVLVVGRVLEFDPIPSKQNLYKSVIDVGGSSPLTIVTNAKNLRIDSLTVVATIGTTFEIDGEEIEIKRQAVGGVYSEGMICDSVMCGWIGGGKGVAVQVPSTFRPGDSAPTTKPRMDATGGSSSAEPIAKVPELSEKERKAKEKEDRKAAAAARKAARKGKKDAKFDAEEEQEEIVDASSAAGAASAEADVECEEGEN